MGASSKGMNIKNRKSTMVQELLKRREITLVLLVVIIVVGLVSRTNNFLTTANFRVLFLGMSTDLMIAIPMAISLIAGNIDFSVGSTLCLSSAVACTAMSLGAPTAVGILIGLATGALLGVVNAVIINKLHVTPLVATLGTWMAYQGMALVIVGGRSVAGLPKAFLALGRANLFGIPVPIIYMITIVLLGMFALKYINFFHRAFFIGSNKDSARLVGINIDRFGYVTYTLTGIVAGFAGIVLAARLGSSSQNAGTGLEFRNVVGLLVGGLSMDGGEGTIVGAVLGILIMQLINNALVLLYINPSYTKVITGAILIFAISIDQFNRRRTVNRLA